MFNFNSLKKSISKVCNRVKHDRVPKGESISSSWGAQKKSPHTSQNSKWTNKIRFYLHQLNHHQPQHTILWGTLLFFISALIWAYFATIDEVTVGRGKIIPSRKVQVIQNLEGGIVKKILVHEGETVRAGQTLMILDDIQFSSDFRANQQKKAQLRISIARLQAQQNNQTFHPPVELQEKFSSLIETANAMNQTQINEIKLLKNQKELLNKELNMTKPLIKEGAVSEVELLRLEKSISEIDGKILAFQADVIKELRENTAELAKLNEETHVLKDRLQRTDVQSPVHGIVKQIHVSTRGGVIKGKPSKIPPIQLTH